MPPLVSICIPTYNSAEFLMETVNSILGQSFTDYELIMVDNASEDDTGGLIASIRDPRLRFYQNVKNVGSRENHNVCLGYATGKYIKFFGSDDVMFSGILQKMVDVLEAHPQVGLVTFNPMISTEDLKPRYCRHHYPGLARGRDVVNACLDRAFNFLGGPSDVMFRRELIGSLRFDSHYKWWPDFRFFCQFLLQSDCDYYNLDEVGSYYRTHGKSDTAVACPPEVMAGNVYDFIEEMSAFNHFNSYKLLLEPIGWRRKLRLVWWLISHFWDLKTIIRLMKQTPVGPYPSIAERLQRKLLFWRKAPVNGAPVSH